MSTCNICGQDSRCVICQVVQEAVETSVSPENLDAYLMPMLVEGSSGHFHLCSQHKPMFEECHRLLGGMGSKVYARPVVGQVS